MKNVTNLTIAHIFVISICLLSLPSGAQTLNSAEGQRVQAAILNRIRNLPHPSPADLDTQVRHVAMVGDCALASVTYGQGGGEVLLKRQQEQWVVVQQGGGAMGASDLIDAGVPDTVASDLVEALQAQWSHP